MPEIRISGSLPDVLLSLEMIKSITTRRKAEGWRLFQADEDWEYVTRQDERVCPVCDGFAGRFVGSQIPIEFFSLRRLGKNEVYPNTHEAYSFLRGDCRCTLEWPDYLFVLLTRLDVELRGVVYG